MCELRCRWEYKDYFKIIHHDICSYFYLNLHYSNDERAGDSSVDLVHLRRGHACMSVPIEHRCLWNVKIYLSTYCLLSAPQYSIDLYDSSRIDHQALLNNDTGHPPPRRTYNALKPMINPHDHSTQWWVYVCVNIVVVESEHSGSVAVV